MKKITFFNSASSCLAHYKQMHWTAKCASFIRSWGTLFTFVAHKIKLIVGGVEKQMEPFTRSTYFSKKRLVVCIHGYNDNPSQFKPILDALRKKTLLETDIFIPRVLQKGSAPLDAMATSIVEEITKWANTHQKDKELILLGISNGGRIARAVETQLAHSAQSTFIHKLHFISIVGACRGSSLVNLVNKLGFSWLLPKTIVEEMPAYSPRNQRLDKEWWEGQALGPMREYTFIASPHDWLVPNYDSSLMQVGGQNARYAIVPGHGHCSIVNAVAATVAEMILYTETT